MPVHVLPPKDAACQTCGKPVPQDAQFGGPQGWHEHDWCCRHPHTYQCKECVGKPASCPTCNCKIEYT